MPLSAFFANQFCRIKSFFVDPSEVVRIVRVDPDLRYLFIKALLKLEDEGDNPHVILFADAPFLDPKSYFEALRTQLRTNCEENAGQLESLGVRFTFPFQNPDKLHPAVRFRLDATALADALPDSVGSLVFVLDPKEIIDVSAFRQSVAFLARQVESEWLKFIVLDTRLRPRLEDIEMEERRLGVQTFYMAPEEIEDKLKQHAPRAEQADPVTHRRTLGILAGFAFARKDYEQAARLQADWGARAESGGAMAEAASAYYNLGNTMLARGELLDAEQQYLKCCELCLQHGTNGLLPMALTNLGVTLFRQDRTAEALESLRVAHRTFKAQRHRPGEAFVYDALASVYVERQQFDEAEKAWFAALEAYKGITSDAFADLRDSGCEDIRAKLTRFYEATGRPNRLSQRRERT